MRPIKRTSRSLGQERVSAPASAVLALVYKNRSDERSDLPVTVTEHDGIQEQPAQILASSSAFL